MDTATILAIRHERQERRKRQFWLANWIISRVCLGLFLVLVIFAMALFSDSPPPSREAAEAALQATLQPSATASSRDEPAATEEPVATYPVGPLGAPVTIQEVHFSHYWPDLGGVNCGWFVNGSCQSHMASGQPWQSWINRAAACVWNWPFGTQVTLPGGEVFVCLDRGGAIVIGDDGIPWIDLLVQYAPVPFGAVLPVTLRFPR